MRAEEIADALKPLSGYLSRAKFVSALKKELLKRGITFQEAEYDEDGNCRHCGESGRCPGVHTEEEIYGGSNA